ncbi:MAG TPA: TIGR02996 domain-containing protein [Gemmataceae bacterium]|nr:TIGR02996 domain-containing protein [Gemmataceae bacterium]
MTDETAFLKAIQAAPGDDAPRLVYADWLDERGDARGQFVRAEVQAAKRFREGNEVPARKLRRVMENVGIEWALSIARPPVGVCTPVRFSNSGSPVTAQQLDTAAKKAGLSIPPDYRAFLLLHNGGSPPPSFCDVEEDSIRVSRIQPFIPDRGFVPCQYRRHAQDEELFASLLPVGATDSEQDSLAVSVAAEDFGAVYFLPYSDPDSDWFPAGDSFADSFAEFLAMLKLECPDGVQLAMAGDAAGMAQWLDAGGDPFGMDAKTGFTLMNLVITGNQPAVLKVILDRKPTFTPSAVDAARRLIKAPPYSRYTEVCKLIETYLGR